jgi:hypothetical protein
MQYRHFIDAFGVYMTVSALAGVDLSLFDIPVTAPVVSAVKQLLVTIRQTKSGRDIMVTTLDPASPEVIAEAKAKGLPLFTTSEIRQMSDCPAEMVDHILAAKVTFPGATIQSIINEAA